ncbi:hypothetical protein EDB83DRAFT_2679386 [Lactarius deliciosus]|nr:hypothetical protein EDB83DRAFT_2679386 [Lactarius deliciosus]
MRHHWLFSSLPHPSPISRRPSLISWGNVRLKHAWSSAPANWETLGCPSAGTTIDLYIALNPHRENALVDALYEVSDPKHPRHVHLTAAPLALAPSFTSPNSSGRTQTPSSLSLPGSHITVCAPPRSQRHTAARGSRSTMCSCPSLPEVLHAHIQAVAPTTYFASTRTLRQTPRRRSVDAAAALAEAEAASGKPVTASELRWLYKTFAYVPTAADRNTLGVFGFQKEYPSETDLNIYMTYFRSDVQIPGLATFTVEEVNGGG